MFNAFPTNARESSSPKLPKVFPKVLKPSSLKSSKVLKCVLPKSWKVKVLTKVPEIAHQHQNLPKVPYKFKVLNSSQKFYKVPHQRYKNTLPKFSKLPQKCLTSLKVSNFPPLSSKKYTLKSSKVLLQSQKLLTKSPQKFLTKVLKSSSPKSSKVLLQSPQ